MREKEKEGGGEYIRREEGEAEDEKGRNNKE